MVIVPPRGSYSTTTPTRNINTCCALAFTPALDKAALPADTVVFRFFEAIIFAAAWATATEP